MFKNFIGSISCENQLRNKKQSFTQMITDNFKGQR